MGKMALLFEYNKMLRMAPNNACFAYDYDLHMVQLATPTWDSKCLEILVDSLYEIEYIFYNALLLH